MINPCREEGASKKECHRPCIMAFLRTISFNLLILFATASCDSDRVTPPSGGRGESSASRLEVGRLLSEALARKELFDTEYSKNRNRLRAGENPSAQFLQAKSQVPDFAALAPIAEAALRARPSDDIAYTAISVLSYAEAEKRKLDRNYVSDNALAELVRSSLLKFHLNRPGLFSNAIYWDVAGYQTDLNFFDEMAKRAASRNDRRSASIKAMQILGIEFNKVGISREAQSHIQSLLDERKRQYPVVFGSSDERMQYVSKIGFQDRRSIGHRVRNFISTRLNGEKASLSAYSGRPILLEFWATWCAPCLADHPLVSKINRDLSPNGLVVIGLSIDKSRSVALNYVTRKEIAWDNWWIGEDGAVMSELNVRGVPNYVLIDRNGVVVNIFNKLDEGAAAQIRSIVFAKS